MANDSIQCVKNTVHCNRTLDILRFEYQKESLSLIIYQMQLCLYSEFNMSSAIPDDFEPEYTEKEFADLRLFDCDVTRVT